MKEIKHFMLPEHTNKLYKDEAISSISLTKEVAAKINELVDAYNELNQTNLAKIQEQDGKIRKGILYMKDNLINTIYDILQTVELNELVRDDVKEVINKRSDELELQIKALTNGSPLPASTIDQMNNHERLYVNTSDGYLYYFNGSSWTKIQKYQSTVLERGEITTTYRTALGDYGYLFSESGKVKVNRDTNEIVLSGTFALLYRDKTTTVNAQTLTIPSNDPYILYFDTDKKEFVFHRPSSATYKANENCVFIGYIANGTEKNFTMNASNYEFIYSNKPYTKQVPYTPADLLSGSVAIDTENTSITFTSAVFSLGNRYVTLNKTITYEEASPGRIKYVCYDKENNDVVVYETQGSRSVNEVLLFSFYQNKLYHAYVNRNLFTINGFNASSNEGDKFFHKTAAFFGDSITRGAGSTKAFTDYIEEDTSLTVFNYGEDGSCVANKQTETVGSFIDRLTSTWNGDIIGIMGGTNDFWNNIPLGTIDSNDTNTFYGALNYIADYVLTNYPTKYIFFMTPIMGYRSQNRIDEGYDSFPYPTNTQGATLDEYCECIRNVCEKYSIPLLDLKKVVGITPLNTVMDNKYYHDGVHPNSEGYSVIAKTIVNFLKCNYR